MKGWFSEQGVEVEFLGKRDVAKLIGDVDGAEKEALVLRQQLAKSSVKKCHIGSRYYSCLNCVRNHVGMS